VKKEVKKAQNNGEHGLCVGHLFEDTECDSRTDCKTCPFSNTMIMGDDDVEIPHDAEMTLYDDGSVELQKGESK